MSSFQNIKTLTSRAIRNFSFQGSKYDVFKSFTGSLDVQAFSMIDSTAQSILKSSFSKLDQENPLINIGLFSRATSMGMLKFSKDLLSEIPKNTEVLMKPVWTYPSDWNHYFSSTLKSELFGTNSKVYWTGVTSLYSFKSLNDLDLSLCQLYDFLDETPSTQNLTIDQVSDLEHFILTRLSELKPSKKLLLLTELDPDNSSYQIFTLVKKVIQESKLLTESEKSQINFNWISRKPEDLLKAIKNITQMNSKAMIDYQQEILVSGGPDNTKFEVHQEWVKEKFGSSIFLALSKSRKFEERQEIMKDLFEVIRKEIKLSLLNPLRFLFQANILSISN